MVVEFVSIVINPYAYSSVSLLIRIKPAEVFPAALAVTAIVAALNDNDTVMQGCYSEAQEGYTVAQVPASVAVTAIWTCTNLVVHNTTRYYYRGLIMKNMDRNDKRYHFLAGL